MIKRKGQIVPKWLVKAIEPKSQHLVKFGCDCEVINNKIYPISDGYIIVIPGIKHVLKKKRQKTVKGFDCNGVSVVSKNGTKNTVFKICQQSNLTFRAIELQQKD